MSNNNFEDKKKEKDIIPSNEEKSTNYSIIFLEPELSKTADEDLILEFIKIIGRNPNKNSVENIYETQNSSYVCGYSNILFIIFDNNFCKKFQIKYLNDRPFIISKKNCLNKKKTDKDKNELKAYSIKKMK